VLYLYHREKKTHFPVLQASSVFEVGESQRGELFVLKAGDMTITEVREEKEEGPPLLDP
jgi:hypothetical protein